MISTQPDQIIHQLDATSKGLLEALEGLTVEQWDWKPAPEVWSIHETTEHTALVTRRIAHTLTTSVLSQPMPPDSGKPRMTDDQIIGLLFDRTIRRPAPEPLHPTGQWRTPFACIAVFLEGREQMKSWLTTVTADLRKFGSAHPRLGMLDAVQWLLFEAAHTERHTRQIREVHALLSQRRGST